MKVANDRVRSNVTCIRRYVLILLTWATFRL